MNHRIHLITAMQFLLRMYGPGSPGAAYCDILRSWSKPGGYSKGLQSWAQHARNQYGKAGFTLPHDSANAEYQTLRGLVEDFERSVERGLQLQQRLGRNWPDGRMEERLAQDIHHAGSRLMGVLNLLLHQPGTRVWDSEYKGLKPYTHNIIENNIRYVVHQRKHCDALWQAFATEYRPRISLKMPAEASRCGFIYDLFPLGSEASLVRY